MQKMSARSRMLAMIGLLVVLTGVVGSGWWVWHGVSGPEAVKVDIPIKIGTSGIARRLKAAGVIRSTVLFRVYAIVTRQAKSLKAGEYAFPAGDSIALVVDRLAKGKVVSHPFTVPEGYTARQIAEKLQQEGFVSEESFLGVVHDLRLVQGWHIPGSSMEGFLFPDTYDLAKGQNAEEIAKHMVDRFHAKVGAEYAIAAQQQQITLLQLVTLASIIEREVRAPQEQPVVASVFYNRLQKKMRLESCATVLYSEERTSGVLSLDDLQSQSPYNTYRHAGLPPGPIGNPGLKAIHAAAYPAKTEYLFFVVRPDGHHEFSKDFETHKRAKWAQKKARTAQP